MKVNEIEIYRYTIYFQERDEWLLLKNTSLQKSGGHWGGDWTHCFPPVPE
jgi:hypothetical protein